ncbi:MAG: hypothetical protein U0Q12_02940 [Vicinamibacterales bacterium]
MMKRDWIGADGVMRLCGAILLAILAIADTAWAQAGSPQTGGSGGGTDQATTDPSSNRPPALQLLGFADTEFITESQGGRTTNTFGVGEFDLFFTSTLARDWSVLAEAVFEAEESNEFKIDLERAVVQWSPHEAFNVGFGRFHNANSYYNTTFPHASWHQVAATRPLSQDFEDEGGLIPAHGVGVSMSGRFGGDMRLRYIFEVTNGIGLDPPSPSAFPDLVVQSSADQNNAKAVNVGLQTRPVWAPGWQFGVAAYFDKVGPTVTSRVDERVVSGHAVFQSGTVEWLTEGYSLRHQRGSAAAASSNAFYTQLSNQFGKVRPYFRFERLDVAARDPFHAALAGITQGPTFGIRIDPTTFVGVKAQVDWLSHTGDTDRKRFIAQVAFAF